MARNLPAADTDGQIDPYFTVDFMRANESDKAKRSRTMKKSLNPVRGVAATS
jgi:Ca2+-dependent lipid-binding protein